MSEQEIIDYVLENYKNGNNVRVHMMTRLDTNGAYDTLIGVYLNGNLEETFELQQVTNDYLDEFGEKINKIIRENTLYLI